jgi:hypothetical protein
MPAIYSCVDSLVLYIGLLYACYIKDFAIVIIIKSRRKVAIAYNATVYTLYAIVSF